MLQCCLWISSLLCAFSSPWPKIPFLSENSKGNRESWGNEKASMSHFSFSIPHPFSPISFFFLLVFLNTSLVLFTLHCLVFYYLLALFKFWITFNYRGLQPFLCVRIHFGLVYWITSHCIGMKVYCNAFVLVLSKGV